MNDKQAHSTIVPKGPQARKRAGDFYFVDSRDFWRREDLNHTEKSILSVLRTYANSEGDCYPTIPQIAQNLGLFHVTVSKYLKGLKSKRELKARYGRDEFGHSRVLYTVPLFRNPTHKICSMARPTSNRGQSVTILNKKLVKLPAWCREGDVDGKGCDEQAPMTIEAKFGTA